jgi:exodeoxyribonuclease V beta subunit
VTFDPCGPLPTGVTVLEASAGTGKTYTIAALAARYVAEGTPLERILLVTFTRMATGELRERVRERLVSVERGLVHGGADDDVVTLLAGDRERAIPRLRRALADFDAATIATTHGFCQEVLAGLGMAGDPDPDTTFVEDVSDLVDEVVDDLYVRRFHRAGRPAFPRAQAAAIVRAAVETPAVALAAASGEEPEMRRRLALVARDELEARKRSLAIMTYDDLLTRLDDALDDAEAVARLRGRYDVVLVDEFQDTDPVQWDILRRAFDAPDVTLVLIGDPKQAIYAFRGADVYAYLDAAASARTRATLETNWRSDQALIDAYDALFGVARLGHPGIAYRRVRAAHSDGAELPGAPLRVRVVRRDHPGIELTPRAQTIRKDSAVDHVARDVAAEIVATLRSGRVAPGDIAVLVPTNRNAARIREALEQANVPAVINGAGSVFATEPAREWLTLLEAIERPASPSRAHSAALTCFVGWSAERVACAEEAEWEALHGRLHDWARALREEGVAALAETIAVAERLPERVLAAVDGERRLTDLRHVAELLHAAARAEQLGTTALTVWLRRRIAEADRDAGNEERSRRLESDADAVQVLTVHRSKGLEFPVVYVPFLWEPGFIPREPHPVAVHDPERVLDVGLAGPEFDRHCRQEVVEQRGEDLRLAYVALTRARHRAVIWWAPTYDARHSPLGRLLFAQDAEGTVAPEGTTTPSDAVAAARFAALRDAAPGCIAIEDSRVTGLPPSWSPPLERASDLAAAVFDRTLDARWRRTSYTDITADAHDARVASEPEDDDTIRDEPAPPAGGDGAGWPPPKAGEDAEWPPSAVGDAAVSPLPLAAMPAGPAIGTFVHRVLEAADFAAPDLITELATHVTARTLDVGDPARVVAGLAAAIETPLGPLLDDRPLRAFRREDRLDELAFELPLAGGEEPSGRLTLRAIAAVLRAHGDELGYAERLEDPALRSDVRGYLTGSIDLVVRLGDRFALLDYKTNWLAPPGEPLAPRHHGPDVLAAEMRRAHYGLQALLYAVALHRFLRWRLPAYDPDRNLAGVLYLFLRGMTGAPGQGVFAWRPSGALVSDLSDVLA